MNTQPSEPVASPQSEGRRGDGILVILQNNAAKTLTVHRMNQAAETILGYEPGKGIGLNFEIILAPHSAEMIEEEIEYKDDAPDLGEVLSRQRELRFRSRNGNDFAVPCTVTRLMSEGMNACFQIVIPDERESHARQKVRDFIALNLAGRQQIDAVTGLPDRATAQQFLPLLKNYLEESGIQACFATLRLDRHPKSLARYGTDGCAKLLQHTAQCCISSFRSHDIVFALSDHEIGLILFDISRESARVVLTRLRWNIGSHRIEFGGKSDFTTTVTLAFDMIDQQNGDGILERCETTLHGIDPDARNGLIELGN